MSLANLYSRETLQHQLQVFPTAFRVLLLDAAKHGDLALADKALDVLDAALIGRMSDTGLIYHDGQVEQNLRAETLLRSLIRVLDGRDFGPAGIAYIDKLLDTAPPDAGTYCLVHAITSPIERSALNRLMARVTRPMELAHSSLTLQGHRLEMTPLAAAVAANRPDVFKQLLGGPENPGTDGSLAADLKCQPAAIKHDRNLSPTTYFLPQWIMDQAHPDSAGEFLDALFDVTKPDSARIDDFLRRHLRRLTSTSATALPSPPMPRPPATKEARHKIASELLRFRDTELRFHDDLLHDAITNACWPVLAAAAAMRDDALRAYLEVQPDKMQTLNLIIDAQGAPPGDIVKCLEIAISNGIDINVRSRQPSEQTILFKAIKKPVLDIAQVLLELGADPDIKDNRGWKAASHCKDPALRAQFETMVDALKAKKAIATTLAAALRKAPHPGS